MPTHPRPPRRRITAFRDHQDYLRALGEEANHRLSRTGRATRDLGRDAAPAPSLDDDSPPASERPDFLARVRATRRRRSPFPWPDHALTQAVGLPRSHACALVLLRALDAPGLHCAERTPEVLADLVVALMRVERAEVGEVAAALLRGGPLERLGLLTDAEPLEPWDAPSPMPRSIPSAVRRFIDGLPTPMQGTRVAEPGSVAPEAWLGTATIEAVRLRCARRRDLAERLRSSDLPTAAAINRLGPVRVALPDHVPGAELAGALASVLGLPIIDARTSTGLPCATAGEVVAEARLRGGAILEDGETLRTEPVSAPPGPYPFGGCEEPEAAPGVPGVLVIELCRTHGDPPLPTDVLRLEPPCAAERRRLWARSARTLWGSPMADHTLDQVAAHALHPEEIVAAVAVAASEEHSAPPTPQHLVGLGRRATSAETGQSDRVPATRLADVVLTPALREQADRAVAACSHGEGVLASLRGTVHDTYGHAPVLLFSGPPGTGKTWLAQAVAGELGRPLRRLSGVDLRSQWYGVAEKKVRAALQAPGDAVLLLDEIDGFLTQRGGGPSAHHDDRLANVLLDELEQTKHLVVMATNLPDRLDAALARRVLFHLRFAAPGPAEREALWRLHLPTTLAGASDVDCLRLAALSVTGGQIKNATFRAILRARRDDAPLSTELVEQEGRREVTGLAKRNRLGFGAERGRRA